MATSTDGGLTYSPPALVAERTLSTYLGPLVQDASFFDPELPNRGFPRAGPSLDACADGTGRLNIVWSDAPAGSRDSDIFYSYSTDEGASWQGPFLVNDVTAGRQLLPAIACQDDGLVHMAWMDFRDDPGDLGPCLYSNEAGETSESCVQFHMYSATTKTGIPPFSNQRLTTTPGNLLNYVTPSHGVGIIGDYIDMDASRFSVVTVFPDATEAPSGPSVTQHLAVSVRKAIVLNVVVEEDMAAVEVLNAVLPEGTTKSVTIPVPNVQATEGVTIFDGEQATADALAVQDPENVVQIPPPGESTNLDILGSPTPWTVTNNGDGSLTVAGLRNTAVGVLADSRPPSITAPANLELECNAHGGATGVNLGSATATDFVDPDPVITNDAPEFFRSAGARCTGPPPTPAETRRRRSRSSTS